MTVQTDYITDSQNQGARSNETVTRAAVIRSTPNDSAAVVPVYSASLNAWIHPDSRHNSRRRSCPALTRHTGATCQRSAASTAATPNGPECLNGPQYPNNTTRLNGLNGLNGLKIAERVERPERPERIRATRTNDLKQTTRTSKKCSTGMLNAVFAPERVERLN